MRRITLLDRGLCAIENSLKTLSGASSHPSRPNPAEGLDLLSNNPTLSAQLMRINHTGEICAQALYAGQALTARNPEIADQLSQASQEEQDHLAWCEKRLKDLGSRTSYLNPLWYIGSFTLGTLAGIAGDRWNLGFLAETEQQVVEHLANQLEELPTSDLASRSIVAQMRRDEAEHALLATHLGAHELPLGIRMAMQGSALFMKALVRWV